MPKKYTLQFITYLHLQTNYFWIRINNFKSKSTKWWLKKSTN